MKLDIIWLICAAIAVVLLIILIVNKRKRINILKYLVSMFIQNYNEFKDIIEKDLDLEGLMNEMEVEFDMSSNKVKCFLLDFGVSEQVKFSNTKELRRGFLVNGDFIQEYEQYINREFGYKYDNTEDFEIFLDALKNVRICCLSKNEDTAVSWRDELKEE